MGSLGAGGAVGGGGGGGALFDDADALRAWLVPFDNAATGCGIALGWEAAGVATGAAGVVGIGLACAGRLASFEGPPPGPPGRSSLPFVIGFAATCFPFGVGFDCELGGSPADVWMVPLLYRSSRCTAGSFMDLTCASFPGFLLNSMLLSSVSSLNQWLRSTHVSPIFNVSDPRNTFVR